MAAGKRLLPVFDRSPTTKVGVGNAKVWILLPVENRIIGSLGPDNLLPGIPFGVEPGSCCTGWQPFGVLLHFYPSGAHIVQILLLPRLFHVESLRHGVCVQRD